MTWREQALCTAADPEMFYPPMGAHDIARMAIAVCNACPVRLSCLEHALSAPETEGIWGGKTAAQRKEIRGRRLREQAARRRRRVQVLIEAHGWSKSYAYRLTREAS